MAVAALARAEGGDGDMGAGAPGGCRGLPAGAGTAPWGLALTVWPPPVLAALFLPGVTRP